MTRVTITSARKIIKARTEAIRRRDLKIAALESKLSQSDVRRGMLSVQLRHALARNMKNAQRVDQLEAAHRTRDRYQIPTLVLAVLAGAAATLVAVLPMVQP